MGDAIYPNPALKNALLVYRQPVLARTMVRIELPLGIKDVLRVAAEGLDRATLLAQSHGATPQELHSACLVYLQSVVFDQGATDSRLLGLSNIVTQRELRDNKRLILKWLHPDRNHNSWESKLFLRIDAAAKRLELALLNENSVVIVEKQPISAHRVLKPHGTHKRVKLDQRLWLRKASVKAVAVLVAALVIVAGIFAVVAVATDGHGFNASLGALN